MLGSKLRIASASPGRDERDCGSPGVESVQRQLLPSKCNAVTRLVRAYAISGSAKDHPEPARSIGQDRNHHGKQKITTSGAFLKTTETPAGSRDIDPRWRLCGERCQQCIWVAQSEINSATFGVCPNRGPARPQTASTAKGVMHWRVSAGCPRNHTRRCRYAYR
jgi:hypothetical protein